MPTLIYLIQTRLYSSGGKHRGVASPAQGARLEDTTNTSSSCPPRPDKVNSVASPALEAEDTANTSPPRPVEFGTVIVHSCSASCWGDMVSTEDRTNFNFRKELVTVHSES